MARLDRRPGLSRITAPTASPTGAFIAPAAPAQQRAPTGATPLQRLAQSFGGFGGAVNGYLATVADDQHQFRQQHDSTGLVRKPERNSPGPARKWRCCR